MADSFIVNIVDGFPHIDKSPGAELTYTLDWVDWLSNRNQSGLASAVVTPDSGLTMTGAAQIAGSKVTALLKAGLIYGSYKAAYRIVSSPDGLIDYRTIVIDIKQR